VLSWAHALQDSVQYLIVKNAIVDPADFSYFENDPGASEFRHTFKPQEITMEYRFPKVEHPARQHGLTIGSVANRAHAVPELQKATVVLRAQAYRRNLFGELDRVKELLLL
jgi:hypothetical protein